MERLTIKNSDGTHSQITETKFIQFFDKVAEFEDFMEEQGFEDLETFRIAIKLMQSMNNVGVKHFAENQALKDRWQKLKELIKKDIKHNEKEFNESYIYAFEHYSTAENWVLDRMQELEKE